MKTVPLFFLFFSWEAKRFGHATSLPFFSTTPTDQEEQGVITRWAFSLFFLFFLPSEGRVMRPFTLPLFPGLLADVQAAPSGCSSSFFSSFSFSWRPGMEERHVALFFCTCGCAGGPPFSSCEEPSKLLRRSGLFSYLRRDSNY